MLMTCVCDVDDPAYSSQVRFVTIPHTHSHGDARTLEIKGGDLPPPDIRPMRISVGYEKNQGSQNNKIGIRLDVAFRRVSLAFRRVSLAFRRVSFWVYTAIQIFLGL
jgi:hypothetical protein